VPLSGNGLAVVHDADALDEATMLAFARETRLSETAFVQSPSNGDATYRNRIWTVARELDFAGHPSLGVAVAEAVRRGERSGRYVQQTPAGLQPIEVEVRADGRSAHAEMLQEPPRFGAAGDADAIVAQVGLAAADLHPELRPQVVSTGLPHLIVPLAGRDALERARLAAAAALTALLGEAVTLYLAVVAPDGAAWARAFFAEGPQANEDPATGSAVGPLCAYLHRHAGISAISVAQGEQMGRPSRLQARIDGDRVRVGGEAVVVMAGEVSF
jgi:trans-2,3-dihydro-3-hydroxyanthranilate isomerase